jgi:hypothetical protein
MYQITQNDKEPEKAEGTKEDHWRDFWMRETGTGQKVAQLLDSYIMMIYVFTTFSDKRQNERSGRVVNTPASNSGGPGFKFRNGDRLS